MDVRSEVVQAAEARARALAEGDTARLRDLLHEEFRWTSHTGESFDRDEYVERNTTGHVSWQAQQLADVEVSVVAEVAVLRAEVTDVIGAGHGTESFRMPVTQVWVRHDGAWRCLAGHAGPRRP
jgi:hypothetical protein